MKTKIDFSDVVERRELIASFNTEFKELCRRFKEEELQYQNNVLSNLFFSPIEVSFVPETWSSLPFRQMQHLKEDNGQGGKKYPAILEGVSVLYQEKFSEIPFYYKGLIWVNFLFTNPVFNHAVLLESVRFDKERTLSVLENNILTTFGIVFPSEEDTEKIKIFLEEKRNHLKG